jgi:hypothetical protein
MELGEASDPVSLITHVQLEISILKDVTTKRISELMGENEILKQQCKDAIDKLKEKEKEISDRDSREYIKTHMLEAFSVKHLLKEMDIRVLPRHYKIMCTNINSKMKVMGKYMILKNNAMHFFQPDKDLLKHLVGKELFSIIKSERV